MKQHYRHTRIRTKRFCDECEETASHRCKLCYKDLCGWQKNKHAIEYPYNTSEDYPDYVCMDCLEKGQPFIKIIGECRAKEDKAIEDWEETCKK